MASRGSWCHQVTPTLWASRFDRSPATTRSAHGWAAAHNAVSRWNSRRGGWCNERLRSTKACSEIMAAAKPAEFRLSRHAVVLTLVSLANLAPVIWFGFLPTRDGPAHAFNADLIRSLWAGHVDAVAGLVRWNPSPVPNW